MVVFRCYRTAMFAVKLCSHGTMWSLGTYKPSSQSVPVFRSEGSSAQVPQRKLGLDGTVARKRNWASFPTTDSDPTFIPQEARIDMVLCGRDPCLHAISHRPQGGRWRSCGCSIHERKSLDELSS